jgi:hypothetical protein
MARKKWIEPNPDHPRGSRGRFVKRGTGAVKKAVKARPARAAKEAVLATGKKKESVAGTGQLPAKKGISLARKAPKPAPTPGKAAAPAVAAKAPTKAATGPAKPQSYATITPAQAETMQRQMLAGQPWTPKQRAALTRYTGGDYVGMNGHLRVGHGGPADQAAVVEGRAAMREIPQAVVAYRNNVGAHRMGFPPAIAALIKAGRDVPQAELDKVVGRSFHDRGFSSTSVVGRSRGGLSLKISVPPGTRGAYVESLTKEKGEHELMLDAGTHFKITRVQRDLANSGVIMHVTVVGQDA